MPQTFLDNSHLEITIRPISEALQKNGYFGYVAIDLYCFRRKRDDKTVCLVIGINPCYDYVQHYVDWMKFAINGSYNRISNKFEADVGLLPDSRSQRSSISVPYGRAVSSFTETTGRHAVAIPQLYHSQLVSHSWKKLRALSKESGVIGSFYEKYLKHLKPEVPWSLRRWDGTKNVIFHWWFVWIVKKKEFCCIRTIQTLKSF